MCSYALRVDDLDAALTGLEAVGVPTVRQEHGLAATDPSVNFGLPIEWTT